MVGRSPGRSRPHGSWSRLRRGCAIMIIDGWMQFPNRAFLLDPMFDALRRWPSHWRELAESAPDLTPGEALLTFEAQGASTVIASAWWGPRGPMITNDEVGTLVRRYPNRVLGIASVDIFH